MRILMEKLKHLLFALLGFALLFLVHAQNQSGFISLDCGLPSNSSYAEPTTGINYISDEAYIDSGKSYTILPEYRGLMQQQAWHVRSFPDGLRNCYNLTLIKGNKYLIRANFMYGNYDGLNKPPTFDLHFGPNLWSSVRLQGVNTSITKELIHVVLTKNVYVCLVNTGQGTPFMSALEVRLLKNNTYVTRSESLNLFTRLDVASTTNATIRFKDDVYDRVWYAYNSYDWTQLSTSLTVDLDSNNYYQPASVVMRTAATPINASAPLNFYIDTDDATLRFYVYIHFAEVVELQANESRWFNISLNGKQWYAESISPEYLYTNTIYSPSALTGGKYEFSIYKSENSTLPPILNAIEIYSATDLFQEQTDQDDVDAIVNIKSVYGVKRIWQGDPCAPQAYAWDGLNCSYDGYRPPRIISLDLSSSGLTGEISSFLSELMLLEYLDLSNNNLTGEVPSSLSKLPLKVLNLQGNNLTGSVPVELIERSNNGSLKLSVGGNPNLCASSSCGEGQKKKKSNVVVPVVTSVAAVAILVTVLATLFFLKRRKKQGAGKVVTALDSRYESLDLELKKNQFTYADLQKITNNFGRVLGGGGFGKVYHGYIDDVEVAVKMLSQSSGQGYQQFLAEVKLLMRVHHRNLTFLVGYCIEGSTMGLIYEYMAHGNLEEHLSAGNNSSILSWEGRLRIAVDAAQGLEYLHHGCKPPIVHRDVKSTNILLNEKFQAKLGDFGLSRSFSLEGATHVSTVVAGTPGYLDPEYYISNRLTEKSDVYSFGVVLLEIITSRSVIARINDHETVHVSQWVSSMVAKGNIKEAVDPRLQGDFDVNSVWKAVEIAMACVSHNSNRRPTMNQVVIDLNECLAAEKGRTKGGQAESKDSIDLVTMNLTTELSPLAR